MYRCKIKPLRHNMYRKTVYIPNCGGELTPDIFGGKEVYICKDCKSVFSRQYIEYRCPRRSY